MTLYVCVLPVGDHWQIVEAIREENGGHSVERIQATIYAKRHSAVTGERQMCACR